MVRIVWIGLGVHLDATLKVWTRDTVFWSVVLSCVVSLRLFVGYCISFHKILKFWTLSSLTFGDPDVICENGN